MAESTYVGMGSRSVPQGGSLDRDIQALSDPAKRRAAATANAGQNLKAAQTGGDIRSLNDRAADFVMNALKPDPKTNPRGYMRDLETRIADMRDKAKEVKRSKSGNIQAEQTYMQVADLLQKKLQAMQDTELGGAEGAQ